MRSDTTGQFGEIEALDVAAAGVYVGLKAHQVVPAPPGLGERVEQ